VVWDKHRYEDRKQNEETYYTSPDNFCGRKTRSDVGFARDYSDGNQNGRPMVGHRVGQDRGEHPGEGHRRLLSNYDD